MKFYSISHSEPHPNSITDEAVAEFLFEHLGKYGDPIDQIKKCLQYVRERGGSMHLALDGESVIGAVVTNETGMSGYIPENILVYAAVNADFRGQGIGGKLIERMMQSIQGGIALHVEPDNPAKRLYERMGFTNKYLEMRYTASNG